MKVLVVDDESAVRSSLRRALRAEGYEVAVAEDGEAGTTAHREFRSDAIVLDVAMPNMNGLDMCRQLRVFDKDVAVLMLTAKVETEDRVAGLDAGADDYLVKPFELSELLARLRALLRRAPAGSSEIVTYGDLVLDPVTRSVRRGGCALDLTKTEYALIEMFIRHADQVIERPSIFRKIWGSDFGLNSNCLEVYINYIRRKLEAGGEPRLVHTVWGTGYMMSTQAPPAR